MGKRPSGGLTRPLSLHLLRSLNPGCLLKKAEIFMGVFPTAPHTPLAIQLTRRRNHYSALRIIFNTTPSNSKKMKSPFCCPPPPIIIYNYILQLLHTHIHPGAPHDYQLTNTTEEKRCTDSFP